MTTATLVVALASAPAGIQIGGKEALEAYASIVGREPTALLLQCTATSAAARVLTHKQANDLCLISGDLIFSEDDQPLVYLRVLCDAHADQYLNEVTIVGRIAGEAKVTESAKSCSRSVAVNRFSGGKEHTDWFKVRGFGFSKDRLESIPTGSIVAVAGSLEQRTNRDGNPYCELKARTVKVFAKGKGGTASDPSAGRAAGYSQEDFSGANDMPFDWN